MSIGFHMDDMDVALLSDYGKTYELKKQIRELKKQLETAKAEAIKEFAEKLKSHKRMMCGNDNGGLYWDQAVLVDDIDRVIKEMTEGEDA